MRGDQYLAMNFDVPEWSSDFYRIVFNIVDRADLVAKIIETLDLDQDIQHEAIASLQQIKAAFSHASLANPWSNPGTGCSLLGAEHSRLIKMLSAQVHQKVSYPKLSAEEVSAILDDVAELLSWLREHQINECDFIRQALVDGLEQLHFRLKRIGWLGWGYTVASLRDVIGAYMALERGLPRNGNAPDGEAVLKKVGASLKRIYEKTKGVKDLYETGDFLLKYVHDIDANFENRSCRVSHLQRIQLMPVCRFLSCLQALGLASGQGSSA
jgi:hypothetical protein